MSSRENNANFLEGVHEAIRTARTQVRKLYNYLGRHELHRTGGWIKNVRILDDVDATVLADFDLPLELLPDGMRLEIGSPGETCPAEPLLRIGEGDQAVDVLDDCLADGDLAEELVVAELELHSLTSQAGWEDLRRDYTWRGRLYADNKGLHCRLTVRLKAS